VGNTTTLNSNPYSWTKLGHVLYIDQPVGTGFSTASSPSPATTNDRVVSDFFAWIADFYNYFPHLLSKKTHIVGESFAGFYIPYFVSTIFQNHDTLPVNLQSISLGDGTFGNGVAMFEVAIGSYIRSQNESLGIPDDILDAFSESDHACGFDLILAKATVYPPKGPIHMPEPPEHTGRKPKLQDTDVFEDCDIQPTTREEVVSSIMRSACYGPCASFDTAFDYLTKLSSTNSNSCFSLYNIKHDCSFIEPLHLLTRYFSRPDVQAALNVSPEATATNTEFVPCNKTIINTLSEIAEIPIPPAYHIIPDLIANKNVSVHIYQGEYDLLINHLGAELVIQNMTWNGMQGFQEKPHRMFGGTCNQSGRPRNCCAAGIYAKERGLTYHLFKGAGHSVISDQPDEMFKYIRDVVLDHP
jgi:carboxypeptidase D